MTSFVVLDCSNHLPGAKVAKLLADRGARVYKIQNPKIPDPTREFTAIYDYYNKKSEPILLDLSDSSDRVTFHEWVKKADVLIEGFRPPTKLKLGLTPTQLHQVNPNLIILSLSGYSAGSPNQTRAGHDINFQAISGTLSLFNEMPPLPFGQLALSYLGALEVMTQLALPTRPKKVIELSVTQALADLQGSLTAEFQSNGLVPLPGKTLYSGYYPCYRIYQAKCKTKISVGALEHKFWARLCETLGLPLLVSEGMTTQEPARTLVILEISAAFEKRPWVDWAPLFRDLDCCVEPVLGFAEALKQRSEH